MSAAKAIFCIVAFWAICYAVVELANWLGPWGPYAIIVAPCFIGMNYGAYRILRK